MIDIIICSIQFKSLSVLVHHHLKWWHLIEYYGAKFRIKIIKFNTMMMRVFFSTLNLIEWSEIYGQQKKCSSNRHLTLTKRKKNELNTSGHSMMMMMIDVRNIWNIIVCLVGWLVVQWSLNVSSIDNLFPSALNQSIVQVQFSANP